MADSSAYRPSTAAEPRGNNDIAVCEVATGKTWTIAKGTSEESPWYDARVSPDGQWIAYQFSRKVGASIFAAKIDGSETRKLLEVDGKKEEVGLEGWSPDSKHVIVQSWGTGPEIPSECLFFGLDAKTGAKTGIAKLPRGTIRRAEECGH